MAVFTVNGQRVETKKNQKLLRFLRDELHLTSVKDGCSEGACGACTVIIDGRTCKACVPDTDLLDGRNIITVEGLTEWEEKVYTYAYGKAVCVPGLNCYSCPAASGACPIGSFQAVVSSASSIRSAKIMASS